MTLRLEISNVIKSHEIVLGLFVLIISKCCCTGNNEETNRRTSRRCRRTCLRQGHPRRMPVKMPDFTRSDRDKVDGYRHAEVRNARDYQKVFFCIKKYRTFAATNFINHEKHPKTFIHCPDADFAGIQLQERRQRSR